MSGLNGGCYTTNLSVSHVFNQHFEFLSSPLVCQTGPTLLLTPTHSVDVTDTLKQGTMQVGSQLSP